VIIRLAFPATSAAVLSGGAVGVNNAVRVRRERHRPPTLAAGRLNDATLAGLAGRRQSRGASREQAVGGGLTVPRRMAFRPWTRPGPERADPADLMRLDR
jgi:hypothetical protein